MSRKLRLFVRRTSPLLAVMMFLAFINLMTTSFPWALFPIAAIGIPVFIIFTQTFLGDDTGDGQQWGDQGQPGARKATEQSTSAVSSRPLDQSVAAQVAQVKSYRQAIENMAKTATNSIRKARLTDLANQFAEWQRSVEQMAERITAFRQDKVIQQDLKAVPESIRKLEAQLGVEKDERMRAQLTRTLEMRRNQLSSLQKLQAYMRQAEIQLESTVASLGTIYSQALANQSTTTIADHADLTVDVNEQVRVLQDQLEALEEVRLGQAAINLANHAR